MHVCYIRIVTGVVVWIHFELTKTSINFWQIHAKIVHVLY
jgi:hypothetical protein